MPMDFVSSRGVRNQISSQSALAPPTANHLEDKLSDYSITNGKKGTSKGCGMASQTGIAGTGGRRSPGRANDKKPNKSPVRPPSVKRDLSLISDQELDVAFQLVDVNSDGSINQAELEQMLATLGIRADEQLVTQMIADVAPEGNGLINKQQFHQLLNRFAKVKDREEEMERDLRAAFQVFDRDGNGYISRDELRLAMEMLGEPLSEIHLDQLMRETDTDRDGQINFNEFCIKFRQLL